MKIEEYWNGDGENLSIITPSEQGNLLQYLYEKPKRFWELIPKERILDIFIQVSKGVHSLHSNSIVHFDIKPENIFISELNVEKVRVVLGDYDRSASYKKYATQKELPTSNVRKFTGRYEPPEYKPANGYTLIQYSKMDIFSLGMTFSCIMEMTPESTLPKPKSLFIGSEELDEKFQKSKKKGLESSDEEKFEIPKKKIMKEEPDEKFQKLKKKKGLESSEEEEEKFEMPKKKVSKEDLEEEEVFEKPKKNHFIEPFYFDTTRKTVENEEFYGKKLIDLIYRMVKDNPEERPTILEVLEELENMKGNK
jgi:serine/threonine protein kinase